MSLCRWGNTSFSSWLIENDVDVPGSQIYRRFHDIAYFLHYAWIPPYTRNTHSSTIFFYWRFAVYGLWNELPLITLGPMKMRGRTKEKEIAKENARLAVREEWRVILSRWKFAREFFTTRTIRTISGARSYLLYDLCSLLFLWLVNPGAINRVKTYIRELHHYTARLAEWNAREKTNCSAWHSGVAICCCGQWDKCLERARQSPHSHLSTWTIGFRSFWHDFFCLGLLRGTSSDYFHAEKRLSQLSLARVATYYTLSLEYKDIWIVIGSMSFFREFTNFNFVFM